MLTCLLLTLLGLAQAPGSDEAARTLALLRTPTHALKFEGPAKDAGAVERAQCVLPLLQAYTQLLGWKLKLEPSLEAELAKLETGLALPGEIARDDVHPLVQTLARERGLCFRFEPSASEPTLLVASASDEHGQPAIETPIEIPVELLPAWANHPAFTLRVDLAHAPAGSEALCGRLQLLLAQTPGRTRVACAESGALRVTGSSSEIAFVVEALAEGSKFAEDLESATFPADPNTPEGKAAAKLPESLRAVFPAREGVLVLHENAPSPSELFVLLEYGRWSQRALLFQSEETRSALAAAPGGADLPSRVPPDWAHEFVSGMLADSKCALMPLPARAPVLYLLQRHPPSGATPLDPAGLNTIRLSELASVAHLAATRFQSFVRLPGLDAQQLEQLRGLSSPDEQAPFWITQLDDPSVFSVIGTPRAITSAVLALRLLRATAKPR